MNRLKFLIIILVIVFFVAVIIQLRLDVDSFMSYAYKALGKDWDEAISDYESAGLEASAPVIISTPINDLTMHGERGVLDDGTIIEEKWEPYKPDGYHYITISIKATGYGEVVFELNGHTKDYPIGNWKSEPIEKAVNEYYEFEIEEPNSVDVANIQPTTVNVSATGKVLTRSVRLTTYGSMQEELRVQASTSGVGVTFGTGKSSFWEWTPGITTTVPAEGYLHYNGKYSITTNDYKVRYSENN